MGVKERILLFIKDAGTTKAAFEKKAGLSNGYIKNFKGNLGGTKLEGILSAFPQLNRVWLLTGEGEMLKSTPTAVTSQPVNDISSPDDKLLAIIQAQAEEIGRLKERLKQYEALSE